MSTTHDFTQSAGRIDGQPQPDVTQHGGEMTRGKSSELPQEGFYFISVVSYSSTPVLCADATVSDN